MALTSEEREILAGLRAGDPGAADRLASLDEASQQRVVAALAQPEGPEPAGSEAGPVTSGAGVVGAAPGGASLGEVRARPPGRSRLLGPLVVLAALVVVAAGGYLLYGRLFGDDASVVVDSSRREDRDRSLDDADDSAGSGGSSSDGQREAPGEAKPAKSDGDRMPTEPAAGKPAPEPMAEEEPADEPMADEPMAEEPMAEEPMAEEPAEEEPQEAATNLSTVNPIADPAVSCCGNAYRSDPGGIIMDTSDQIIVAGSSQTTPFDSYDLAVSRYLPSGVLDRSFGEAGLVVIDVGGRDVATGVLVDASGRIVVSGFTEANGFADFVVARLLASGELDRSFGEAGLVVLDVGGGDVATGVLVDASGRIVVSGFTEANGFADFVVARLLASGELDRSFGEAGLVVIDVGGRDVATGVLVDASGRIVVSGFTEANGFADFVVARLLASGELDRSFGEAGLVVLDVGGGDVATGVVVDASGRIVVSGFTEANGFADFVVARLLASGELDRSFGEAGLVVLDVGGGDVATGVLVDASGRIVVSGYTEDNDSSHAPRPRDVVSHSDGVIVRLNETGSLDTSFNGVGYRIAYLGHRWNRASDVVLDPTGKPIIVGYCGGSMTSSIAIARYESDGRVDEEFGRTS